MSARPLLKRASAVAMSWARAGRQNTSTPRRKMAKAHRRRRDVVVGGIACSCASWLMIPQSSRPKSGGFALDAAPGLAVALGAAFASRGTAAGRGRTSSTARAFGLAPGGASVNAGTGADGASGLAGALAALAGAG